MSTEELVKEEVKPVEATEQVETKEATPTEEPTKESGSDVVENATEEPKEEAPALEVGSPEWIKQEVENGVKQAISDGGYVSQKQLDKIVSKRLNRDRKKRKLEPPKEPNTPNLSLQDFNGDAEQYNKHLVDSQFQQRDYQQQKAQYEQAIQAEEMQALSDKWQNQLADVTAIDPEAKTKIETSGINELMSDDHAQDLIDAEYGGRIALFLSNNLQEAEKYSRLDSRQRLMYLARMSIKVENQATPTNSVEATQVSQTPQKVVSKAPAPTGATTPNPNGGSGLSKDPSQMTQAEYSAYRAKTRRSRFS